MGGRRGDSDLLRNCLSLRQGGGRPGLGHRGRGRPCLRPAGVLLARQGRRREEGAEGGMLPPQLRLDVGGEGGAALLHQRRHRPCAAGERNTRGA